jgi:RNA polymerase sigma-70 factor (ECF subfamily)
MTALAPPEAVGPVAGLDLGALFAEYAPQVWRTLRRMGVREAEVEDLCQEVFLIAHRKLGSFEGRSSIKTWIYGIAARAALDHRRLARVRREMLTDSPPDGRAEALQEGAVERREAAERLDQILGRMDADKRAVFVLYEVEELTMAEVAEAVGCPLKTAYARLYAARKIAQQGFERRGTA